MKSSTAPGPSTSDLTKKADLGPAEGGAPWQVFEFLHESPQRSLLGATPAEFLADQVEE